MSFIAVFLLLPVQNSVKERDLHLIAMPLKVSFNLEKPLLPPTFHSSDHFEEYRPIFL